jgi:hypothetical protein
MKSSIIKTTFSVIMLILSFTGYGQSAAGTEQKLIQLERNRAKAVVTGDSITLDAFFADEYEGDWSNSTYDKKALMQFVHLHPMKGYTITDIDMDAKEHGTFALVKGIWEIKSENGNSVYAQFRDVFMQQKKVWRVITSTQNVIPAWRVRNLEDSELVEVNPQNCEEEPKFKSLNGEQLAFFRIKNNTPGNIRVYWINYSGERDQSEGQKRLVASGKSIDITTYLTHPFIAVGENGKCYGIYKAASEPSLAVIKD